MRRTANAQDRGITYEAGKEKLLFTALAYGHAVPLVFPPAQRWEVAPRGFSISDIPLNGTDLALAVDVDGRLLEDLQLVQAPAVHERAQIHPSSQHLQPRCNMSAG